MGLDKDDIKQLIAILQKGLVDNNDADTDTDEAVDESPQQESVMPTKKSRPNRGLKQKSQKKQKFENKFLEMSESKLHKDDVAIDKKLCKLPPTQRTRSYQQVKVKCRVCGREEEINPVLIESRDRYKCNKCATSPG
ncbi:hypothetical protein EB001_19350 [bacterium]|nr:hypothetical protein [bacterium]